MTYQAAGQAMARMIAAAVVATIAGIFVVFLLPAVVGAHHGLAEFDQTRPVTLRGSVTAFRFVSRFAIGKLSRASGTHNAAFLSRGAGFRFAGVTPAQGFFERRIDRH